MTALLFNKTKGMMKMRLVYLGGVLVFFISSLALGDGFDERYKVYQGDYNSDGLTDFYIYREPEILILHDDIAIPIVLPTDVAPFLLIQNPVAQSFDIQSVVSDIDLGDWQRSGVKVDVKDFNYDGFSDLKITGISEVVVDAFDQLIFANSVLAVIPMHITAMTAKFERFTGEVFQWMLNPDFFRENAPWIVDGIEPASKIWDSTVVSATNYFLINFFINLCESEGKICAASRTNPVDCIKLLDLYDDNGNYVETKNVNVCQNEIQIYSYVPGSVTLVKDYSVFSPDAVEYAEAVEVVTNEGVNGVIDKDPDTNPMKILREKLAEIIRRIFGEGVFAEGSNGDEVLINPGQFCQANNSFEHASFPLDDTFDNSDPTWHHYDVETKVCDLSEPGCSVSSLTFNMLLKFTYPSRKLVPTYPSLNGITNVMAYVSPPFFTHKPSAYVLPIGHVTQTILGSAENWPGAFQNLTRTNHGVYPGTISRVIVEKNNGLYIFTHGIGLNRAFNTHRIKLRPIHILLGCANDVFGEEGFKQLDREAIKYKANNQL